MYSKRNFNFNFIYLISSHPSYFSQIILFLLPFPLFLFRLDYLSVSYLLLIFSIIIKVHFYLIFIFCLHISHHPYCSQTILFLLPIPVVLFCLDYLPTPCLHLLYHYQGSLLCHIYLLS
uniref:Uncharacterized protein n=1 Tax=Cacopsylla melanoneura TaxID=428564 RepID=A0A8D8ZNW5_9HEMI